MTATGTEKQSDGVEGPPWQLIGRDKNQLEPSAQESTNTALNPDRITEETKTGL